MGRELFGTDGVRGIAGEYPLDVAGSKSIGRAVGTHFAEPGNKVVIACDTRESSTTLVTDIAAGLNSVGVDVVSAGVMPTPGLAYTTRQNDEFVAGIMITASHNPHQFNGIKVFDRHGDKLSDETETRLNTLIVEGVPDRANGNSIVNTQLGGDYEDFLVASAGDTNIRGLSLAIDTANGAASGLAQRVFERLGASVTPLFDEPDGRNINDHCGATDTKTLSNKVTSDGLNLGIAVDGDADRIMLVDDQGRQLNGDHVLYILAVADKLPGVVATVMSNLGAEQSLASQGIKMERVAVGDRYVLEGLKASGYRLGGEQSGHIIMPELLATGDALLAAVQVLRAVQVTGKSLAQWYDEVELLPQALVNIPMADKASLDRAEVKSFLTEQTAMLEGKGRLLIRPSGTEPLARVMVEADDAQNLAESIAKQLKEVISP